MDRSCSSVRDGPFAASPAGAPARTNRIEYVETVRGLTCLLVCLFHAIGDSPHHGLHVPVGSWAWTLAHMLDVVNMPLFAFVAGRVFWIRPEGPGGVRTALAHKLLRLLVPFLTVTSLWVAAAFAFGTISLTDGVDFFLHARGHLWFLQALAWLTLAATVGFLLFPGAMVEFSAAATAVSLVAAMTLSRGESSLLSWNAAFDLMPFYFLGLFFGALHRTGRTSFEGTRAPILSVVFGILLGVGIFLAAIEPEPFHVLQGPTAHWYLIALPFLALVVTRAPKVAILRTIARYSYTIYLFHVFAMAAVRLPLLTFEPATPLVPTIVLLLIVGVTVPIGLDRLIDKSGVLRFLLHGVMPKRRVAVETREGAAG